MSEVTEELFRNMNEFENLLSEGDIHHKELLKYQEAIEEGFDHIDHLLELHDSLPDDEENIPAPAVESIRIYLDRTMDYLGLERISLEENDMVPYQEWKVEQIGENKKKIGLWNKIMEMIKKIFRAVMSFLAHVMDIFKSKYNIIFVMMDKIFHNYDKALEALDPKFVSEHSKLQIKNSKLARYFRVTDGKLGIHVAYNLCDQYKFFDSIILHIADSLLKLYDNMRNKTFSFKKEHLQLNKGDIGDILTKLDSLVLVDGFKFTVDENNNVVRNMYKGHLTEEFVLDIGNKEGLIALNKENKENAKNIVQTYNKALGAGINYWLNGKLIGMIEEGYVNNYKKKYPYASEDVIAQVRENVVMMKKTALAGAKLLNDMFYLETESYRANVKFIGVVLTALHKAKEAK